MNPLKAKVHDCGVAPDLFLEELIAWGKSAPEEIFAPNAEFDIYSKVKPELGPWQTALHRRAVMLEVMRVLAGFESSWKWTQGTDTSKGVKNTASNAEAGAWQTSYDARTTAPGLDKMLASAAIKDGLTFQRKMKADHAFAMEFVARLMRKNTGHNGPLYRGEERQKVWPRRKSLWDQKESIYPWLSQEAVKEFTIRLAS